MPGIKIETIRAVFENQTTWKAKHVSTGLAEPQVGAAQERYARAMRVLQLRSQIGEDTTVWGVGIPIEDDEQLGLSGLGSQPATLPTLRVIWKGEF